MPRGSSLLQTLFFLSSIQGLWAGETSSSGLALELNLSNISKVDLKCEIGGEQSAPAILAQPVLTQILTPLVRSEKPGLINHGNICYMNAIATALFSSVTFRSLIYKTTPYSAVMFFLAQLFGSLQTATEPIRTDLFFIKSFHLAYPAWRFGAIQCSLEFVSLLLAALGPEVEKKMRIGFIKYRILENEESRALFDANVAGRCDISALTKFSVSSMVEASAFPQIDPSCYESIQAVFDKGFRDTSYSGNYEYSIISEITGEQFEKSLPSDLKTVKVFDFHVVTELPESFVLGIKRTAGTDVFYNNRMVVNPTLRIRDISGTIHDYKLQSFAYYIESYRHYVSFVCDHSDHGTWYQYNDSLVSKLTAQDQIEAMYGVAATNATFVVYVRSDLAHEAALEIPERYMPFVNLVQFVNDIDAKDAAIALAQAEEEEKARQRQQAEATADNGAPTDSPCFYGPNNPNTDHLKKAVPEMNLDDYEFVDIWDVGAPVA
jgi:hypothetical protein